MRGHAPRARRYDWCVGPSTAHSHPLQLLPATDLPSHSQDAVQRALHDASSPLCYAAAANIESDGAIRTAGDRTSSGDKSEEAQVGAALNELPDVGSFFQVDVGEVVWKIFVVYFTTADTIYLIKHDEPDFFEKIDISQHQVGEPLVLPADMRPLPDDVPAPILSNCIVWAWCFDHLKAPERLTAEVLLPGLGGNYRVTEEKRVSMSKISWVKRVQAPGGSKIFKTLPKLARHLFDNKPEQLDLALKALDDEVAAAQSDTTESNAPEDSNAPDESNAEDMADARDRAAHLVECLERAVQLRKSRKMAKDCEADLERLDEHTAKITRSNEHTAQLTVPVIGTAEKQELERALLGGAVVACAKTAFDETAAAGKDLEREVGATQEAVLAAAADRLREVEQAERETTAQLRVIEATKGALAGAPHHSPLSASTAGVAARTTHSWPLHVPLAPS